MPKQEQWFYEDAAGGAQVGPISPATLEKLRAQGTITTTTRIWKKGLPDWQAMHTIDPSLSENQPCAECGAPHPPRDLLQYGNVPICAACKDTVVAKLQLGNHIGQGLWADGKFLIVENNKPLPKRCFKCNASATAAYHVKRSWAPWWPGLIFTILYHHLNPDPLTASIFRRTYWLYYRTPHFWKRIANYSPPLPHPREKTPHRLYHVRNICHSHPYNPHLRKSISQPDES